jgi:glycerol-3-phosphate dehydrogenase (NAD(P)+)
LSVIGAGSWGTALAIVLAPRFEEVRLWVYESDLAERMSRSRQNDIFLPSAVLPANVAVRTQLPEALENAGIVLGVMPSHHARRVYSAMLDFVSPGMLFVSATKGIENGTLLRMSEVIAQAIGPKFAPRVAVLSGPTFAREVARGEPTALVVSSHDAELARRVQSAFSGPTFRLYTNGDPIGVELGGALKNVIAIGAGIIQGLGLGSNAMAALITRGLAEITRVATLAGGAPLTLAGLAGSGIWSSPVTASSAGTGASASNWRRAGE